jgi:hypothetical protein
MGTEGTNKEKREMAHHSPTRHGSQLNSSVIQWLLDGDPAIRWQALDLIGAPTEAVAAERARVATEGLGARR